MGAGSLLWCLVTMRASAGSIDGPEFTRLAFQSVDVMREHHWLLKRQLELDEIPFHLAYQSNFGPHDVEFGDGTTSSGSLERHRLTVGAGGGNPTSGGALFAGVHFDVAQVQIDPSDWKSSLYDTLLYAGVAVKGYEVSYGLRLVQDPYFIDESGEFVRGRDTGEPSIRSTSVVTAEHAEGVFLGGTFRELVEAGSSRQTVEAVRGLVQPEALLERLDLRRYGAPALGVDRLAPGTDYYGEGASASRSAAKWEIPLSVDDLMGVGLRLGTVTQVAPEVRFRQAEIGWVFQGKWLYAGGRALTYQRAGEFVPSWAAFAGGRWEGLGLGMTYAYNSPDSRTFYAVPDQHVLGVQVVFGDSRMAQPVVPIFGEDEDED